MSFAVSISILGLFQAALVALPRPRARFAWMPESPWWALLPAMSIVVTIGVIELASGTAGAYAWLALLAVPPLAALALGWLVRGATPAWALLAVALFALAWASQESLAGETAATLLSGLACITLGWMLVSVVPARRLRLGIYAMAAIDAALVAAQLLQDPSAVLSAAAPGGLPRLQVLEFGAARMGFGDAFVAATVGCLLAATRSRQLQAAVLVAALALVFDLFFFVVDTLPATVPVALALLIVERSTRSDASGVSQQSDRVDAGKAGDGEGHTTP